MAAASRPGTSTTDVAKWDAYHKADTAPPWESGLHCSHLSSALAKLGSPGLAVEVGCGGGHSTLYLAASGWRAVGLDVSEHAIARAASLAAELSVPVAKDLEAFAAAPPGTAVFFCADILKSDVPGSILGRISPSGAGVDLLFDCQTFHVLRFIDESRAASAYAELVRPGGKLIMLCGADGEPERTAPGPPALSKEAATGSIAAAGFTLDSCDRVRFDATPSYGNVPPLAWLIVCTRNNADACIGEVASFA